ncbi:MAG TPA: sigma-54 dependent transcriptional regulator [Phycisphaerae bacterium]|jgi:two-component system response regulator AtoC|nr:sigma-54-dependent Fis family transcriptional regulator [Phycisphaerae bacterium]HOB73884.1 sigma-54 dependent transcriptional regulator [Phycisphaerae bacterium]HOJ56146.1 sigma-54 dependent transcriptional regulator [Phycisphaerae bacterium]HOL28091.1 sigma-54 dependent transcriptional regulator [Phycisphaerae bacterium]HPP19798.1 sigma-54 dependent transcriptional regulator [Phycisphaerae bacterium]
MSKILIVEDEVTLARSMGDVLREAGHEIRLVHVGEKVAGEFRAFGPQLLIMDVRLGGVNGLVLLEEIKRESPDVEAIVVTAYGSVEVAVEAMKRGAADFLTKPIDLDVLAVAVEKVLSASQARRRLEQFRSAAAEQLRQVQFLGEHAAIVAIREQVARLAERFRQGTGGGLPAILLTGETGTGKDLLATYIHAALPHRTGPFVAVNCSAVPAELFESELFGHQKGAFSGATGDKPGLFETADGGTLFLDEIGDLPMAMQPKLLRALETHTIRRIGDTRDRPFDVCLIAATNRDLASLVAQRRFREDLYYRLKVVSIALPPLRDRGDDVVRLAERFCAQLAAKYGLEKLQLSSAAREVLKSYVWPGNVRELRHALESAALSITGTTIEPQDLPAADPVRRAQRAIDAQQPVSLEQVERELIEQALQRTGGNVSAAARLLSIGREALRYRMAKFGLVERTKEMAEGADGKE